MDNIDFADLPWDSMKEVSEKGIFEEVFKKIPKSRFEFVAKKENFELLVDSALKSLKKKYLNVSYDQGVTLAKLMQNFAQKVINTK